MDFLKDDEKFEALTKDVFITIDENENGYIEFSELKRTVLEMYKQTNVKQMSDEKLQDMINTFDKDENSILNQEELGNLLRQILEKSVQLQQEEEKKNKKKADKNEPTTFRSKKITTKDRELQKQEIQQLKSELNNLKKQDKKSQQLQNQKLVNYYVNSTARDEEVREQQEKFDASSKSLSVQSPHSSKSSINLNPLVFNQYLRQGFIKNADDMIKAQESAKNNHLIGMAVKRSSAGDWQGLIDYFNDQTQKEFDRTPSSQQFHIISKKLSKNVKFIMIHIQNLTYTNFRDLRINSKSELSSVDKPALFFWELFYNGQTYYKNSAKEFPNQLNECLDTVLIYNYTHPIQVILWKKQGKDSVYVGQFDIKNDLFQLLEKVTDSTETGEPTQYKLNLNKINKQLRKLKSQEIKLYRKKRINYSNNSQEDPPLIGDIIVKFQMFEICEFDAPINQFSYTKGSPRSLEERERRMLVENSKYGPYKWPDDQHNKALVVQINEAGIELAIVNEEDIQSYLDGQLGALIKETFYFDTNQAGSRKTSRIKRPQLSENTIALLKSLDENPLVVQVNALRQTIRQGRLSKKALEEALYQFGCTGSQLLIDHVDDMGMCEYDYCMDDGSYSIIIDTIQDMDFKNPDNIQQADIFAEKLIQNIKSVLIEGIRIEPLFEFLKVAEKIPDFGITINLISDQFKNGLGSKTDERGNVQIDAGSFISYFDINSRDFDKMENYEHIMVLGKLVKLAKKHLQPDDPFLEHIQQNYEEAKTKIYFTVPVLPKKKKLREKAKLLILQSNNVHPGLFSNMDINKNTPLSEVKQKFLKKKKEMQDDKENKNEEQDPVQELEKPCLWNVCHELVRRKRWNMFYEGFQAEPLFYFQQGGTGSTPLMDFFEKGPFNVINQMINQYHPNNPNEDNKDLPKLDPKKIFDMTTPKRKSFVHALALNQDINPIGQKLALQSLLGLVEPQQQEEILVSPMSPYDATPLVLYITKLSSVVPAFNQEEIKSIQEILNILKQPLIKEFNQSLFRAKCFFKVYNFDIEKDNLNDYYHNHIQLSKSMVLLQPGMFSLVSQEIDWIQWFSLNIENYEVTKSEIPFAIYNLARQGKIDFLENLLEEFQLQQSTMPCVIKPDLNFNISSSQEEFISDENDQITIYNQDQSKKIQFSNNDMLNAMAQFYAKYPLEVFIGIQQILNETKFTTLKLNRLLKDLILQTIKMEPRILAKQFYMNQKSPFEELVKLGMEEDLQKILTPEQIESYQEKKSNFAKNLLQDGLTGQLKNKENPLNLGNEEEKEFLKYTSKLMTEKGVDDVLKFIDKLKQDNIEGRQGLTIKLLNQIAASLPTKFSKQQYPKLFKALRTNKQTQQSEKKGRFYEKNPKIAARQTEVKKINNYTMKQVLNAALYSNNQQLINNCLLYLWNKSPDDVSLRSSSVLRPLYQKYGQYYRSLSQHPAVCLNQQEFDKYMNDTKDVATIEDYTIAAKALTKNGLPDRLPIFLKKLAANKPEVVFNLLEDMALNILEKQLREVPVAPLKPNQEQVQKVQPQFVIPTKRQVILSQYSLIDAGALGYLIQNAKKLLEKSANLPKSWNSHNHMLNKQAFQQYYAQKLRQNFYTQNPGTMYNNWNAPKSNIEKTVEVILDALKDSLDNLLQKKPELKDKLEKISLLPLISNNISILDKLNNKEERIFKAIENIILQNLKQKPSNLELTRIDKRMKMNLQFLEQNFQPTLKTVMEKEKNRSLRIFRALDYTLKKEQQPLQLQFATEVVLIIVKNFVPDDFSGIFDKNVPQLFNALAVSLMRSKSTDPRALEFMGSQLNKYQFFDLVCSLELGEQDENVEQGNENRKQSKAKTKTKTKDKFEEVKVFRSIESMPAKTEIEPAERLVVPSQNNIPYFIKLLKAKVKPFFQTYQKDKDYVNGKGFEINDIKNLNLFEYLIVKCHYTLISKHYINVFKPKNPLTEAQIIKYLCLASSCGSYTLFDLITDQILNLKFPQLYKDYEKFPQFQKYLNLPIFYQVLMYSSEQSSIKFFENIIVDGVNLNLFYNWMKFNIEEKDDTQNISKYNCFVPIITKKYGLLLNKIVQFLRKLLKNNKDYYENLTEIMNNRNFIESEQDERLSLLEFSIYQGFPDFCMIFDKNIILRRNPFEDQVYQLLEEFLNQCSSELKQEDSILINYCTKYDKDQGNYRVMHYKIYLMLKKYFEGNSQKLQSLQTSVMLFKIMLEYKPDQNLLLNVNLQTKLTQDINTLKIDKLIFYEQFFYLHLCGFDKVMKYQLGISDYVRQFHSKQKLFWIQLDVIEAFKTYFKFDYTKELKIMDEFELSQLTDQLDQFTPEVLLYIYYNQPDFFERMTQYNEPLKQFGVYKYTLPIIRHQSTQDILQPIEQKKIKKSDFEKMVEAQQEYFNKVVHQVLIEDVESNYQYAAILVLYISTCNEQLNYIGEGDTTIYKIIPIVNQILERLSIQDLDCFIIQLIYQIRNNDLYNTVMEWTQQSKAAINKDIFKEKTFIQGLLNFLNVRRKSENFTYNYQQNDLLKIFQFEFSKTDKMCKDKIYRGFCILHIVLNFISEIESFKQYINKDDQITINIELMEQSKGKNIQLKILSIKEITIDKVLTGFNYQIEIPMIYYERNNILNLQVNQSVFKEFQEYSQKQIFENIKIKDFQEELRSYSRIVNLLQVQLAIKPNQLSYDIIDIVKEQLQEKFPFQFGYLYNNLLHDITLDKDIFYEDENNNKIIQRKNLKIEEEVNVLPYFDVSTYQYEITLNILILKKVQYFSKCNRETQLKQLIDDFTRKQNQLNYIKKFLSSEENNVREYQTMMELMKEKKSRKKQSQLNDIDFEELKQLEEKYKNYQVPPYFVYELEWPIYIENNKIQADEYNFPPLLFKKLISIMDGVFFETVQNENENKKSKIKTVFIKDQSFQINYISFIDTLVMQFIKILELKSKSRTMQLSIEDVAYQALEWPFLKYIMNLIKTKIEKSNLLFEMKESSKPEIQINLPGIDECVQLSKTTYFFYSGMYVVRLGVFFNKKLLKLEKTENQNLRYSQNFSLDFNLEPYINYIINETQLQAVLKKENNSNIQNGRAQ